MSLAPLTETVAFGTEGNHVHDFLQVLRIALKSTFLLNNNINYKTTTTLGLCPVDPAMSL